MNTLQSILHSVKNGQPFWLRRNINGGYDWHICTLFGDEAEEIRFLSRGESGHDDFTCFTDNYLDGMAYHIQEPEEPC